MARLPVQGVRRWIVPALSRNLSLKPGANENTRWFCNVGLDWDIFLYRKSENGNQRIRSLIASLDIAAALDPAFLPVVAANAKPAVAFFEDF